MKTKDLLDASSLKGKTGLRRVLLAAGYSLQGLQAALRHEAAFRQLGLLAVVLVPLALWLDISRPEKALLIAVVFLALIVELLNSAIEVAIDRISLELHPLSKRSKDMGSAAQLLAMLLIAITWLLVLV
ncbi:diacylglycerol kinase [Halopseudomonas salegens]|uniref:Diacylglycerol kinase n=1 Tax=Halopseudomonas salegens TaxID=1434072 RepID=A0A1H2HQ59_9GAMM|nr:diacylglycerol kinase [Halopseudomonas salegens]SDU33967.1 diacylglycerol kinase [Halopseudomonas salegens]